MTYPAISNVTGLSGMFSYANSITSNYLGVAILTGLFFIITVYQINRDQDIAKTFVVASWSVSIVGIFFYFLEMIDPVILFSMISLLVLSSLWTYFKGQ